MEEKLIIEKSRSGRKSYSLPAWEAKTKIEDCIPSKYLRKRRANLPEVAQIDITRHFTRLSHKNFSVDTNFYPLGSCTMKYNPKFNEQVASMPEFAHLHPLQPDYSVQGTLKLMYNLEKALSQICGMDAFTLHPSAGAHGELTGMLIIKAYHEKNNQAGQRTQVIVPDSSHGTNPASANIAGFEVITVPSDEKGMVDLNKLKESLSDKTAALMLTNPNTLGVFEVNVKEIARMTHSAGALLYYDGANLNPLLGLSRPGDMGFDVVHVNLHKTFSTPHGGGGPGSGPVGVKKRLIPFLPVPRILEKNGRFSLDANYPDSIGKITAFYGNTGVILRAYAYILINGIDGLTRSGNTSILNSNYIMAKLKNHYHIPYSGSVMHEFVISLKEEAEKYGVRAIDVAKWLIDNGIHPPTIYFPLIVAEALMIEPTETESKETLDEFIDLMIKIKQLMEKDPELFHHLPQKTDISRPNEVLAARNPVLNWNKR